VQRRALLRGAGVAALATTTGCAVLPWTDAPTVDPTWQTTLGNLATVTPFEGWHLAEYGTGPPRVAALDPADGSVELRCRDCLDLVVADGLLLLEHYGPGRTVQAYDSPVNRRWEAPGRVAAVGADTVFVRRDVGAQIRARTELSALDRATGESRWTHAFETTVRGYGGAHVRSDYYAVHAADDATVSVVCLDTVTGDQRWRTDLGSGAVPRTTTGEDAIVVGTERPTPDAPARVQALDRGGDLRWERAWPAFYAYPQWVGEPMVLLSIYRADDRGQTVAAVTPADGKTRWTTAGTVLDVTDGVATLYESGAIVHRDIADGTVTNRLALTDAVDPGADPQLVLDGDTLFVAADTTLTALAAGTASIRWRFRTDTSVGIAAVLPERVYAHTMSTVYAIDRPASA